ncbi:hypothetical protein H4582DRAFT_1583041 [Lactarius indigo]|nr:hypothetical protein H4582DRAFT_1583041 [Lactarius indigo]
MRWSAPMTGSTLLTFRVTRCGVAHARAPLLRSPPSTGDEDGSDSDRELPTNAALGVPDSDDDDDGSTTGRHLSAHTRRLRCWRRSINGIDIAVFSMRVSSVFSTAAGRGCGGGSGRESAKSGWTRRSRSSRR